MLIRYFYNKLLVLTIYAAPNDETIEPMRVSSARLLTLASRFNP